MRLQGKVAIISGGARGMGAVEAKLFAKEGAKVVLGDVLEDLGKQVAREIEDSGGDAAFVKMDVRNKGDWDKAVDTAMKRFGKVNVLVNNAGIFRRTPIEKTTEADWDEIMDVNGKGVFLGCMAGIPAMLKSGGGSIINISSISGIVSLGTPPYNASKGAVRIMTKTLAVEYAKKGMRVNSIHPGVIDTDMMKGDTHTKEEWDRLIPIGRWARAEEVAYGALFLASDESSYITGTELVIDGGFTAQ
jgi:cyclopentanol dehydrogenase